jgi:hypothetical protein
MFVWVPWMSVYIIGQPEDGRGMEGAESRVGPISECDGWSDDCGSDFGRIVAIWKVSVRPSRGWSWVVGKPSLIGRVRLARYPGTIEAVATVAMA